MKITLCGSARFESEFRRMDRQLTLAGHVVYNLAVYPSEMGGKDWYNEVQKKALDKAHIAKIDNSDAIVVINTGAYIGDSTSNEINYAIETGKARYYTSVVPGWDKGGIRLCPYNYCRDAGLLTTPPCAVCYE